MMDSKSVHKVFAAILVLMMVLGCNLPAALTAQPAVPISTNEPTQPRQPAASTATQATPRQETRQAKLSTATLPTSAAAKTLPLSSVRITLGQPQQIFHYKQVDAIGMFNVPDMHTAVLQQPDKSYLLWITGNIGPSGGSVARLSTNDFIHYANAGPGTPTKAGPVFTPSCPAKAGGVACSQDDDADYVGANAVPPAHNGKDLLMFYEAGNKSIGSSQPGGWEYNVMSLARSADNGLTWTRQGPVLSGTDPKPTSVGTSQPGISEPGIVESNGFIYMFYQYIPNQNSEPEAPSVIQAARAPIASDGRPGAWMKYYNGAWGEPGLGGKGSAVVATGDGSGCTRPVQVWPAFNDYLNAFVLTFLCNEGWFFSTSTDMVDWTPPMNFMPMQMWQNCKPMDWNYILVTPGKPGGVIGQIGLVLYAHSDSKGLNCSGGFEPHELWVRPFTFSTQPIP